MPVSRAASTPRRVRSKASDLRPASAKMAARATIPSASNRRAPICRANSRIRSTLALAASAVEHERQHSDGIGGNDLRPLVTDPARQRHGLAAALKGLLEAIEIEEAVADHAEVGDFDASVAVRPAQLDASR